MYLDERRASKQQPSTKTQNPGSITSAQRQNEHAGRPVENDCSRPEGSSPPSGDWKAARMLDSANNKLQELMQLLYLLSRDPGVPKDARYHVTVAQGEIALLAHVMRNSAQPESSEVPTAAQSRPSAHP
jgi:hypothetical protein